MVSADESADSMLVFEVEEIDGGMLNYFMQPNNLPDDHEPKGIQENGMVSINVGPGHKARLPSDWSFFLSYSFNIQLDAAGIEWPESGHIRI